MATNLALDDHLIADAVKLGKHKTKREAVTAALEDYVKKQRRLGILRRRAEQLNPAEAKIVAKWTRIALEGDVALIGPIRQELLSGIQHRHQFDNLQKRLDDFTCLETRVSHHDRAATCFNACRTSGVAAGAIDMIICASAIVYDVPIMTNDPDFGHYAKHLPIRLLPLP